MAVIWTKNIKELVGTVVSAKNEKSITVEVDRVKVHPLYGKRYTVTKKFHAHDEEETAQEWDRVKIRVTKPISKTKRWKLIEVVSD